jgi:AcrR family transcriptional regulator
MAEPPPRGRPRDPEVEERAVHAALEVFGETGWAEFNIDNVARRSGVGKASLYLRWGNREELLIDAIGRGVRFVEEVNTGSLRGDLRELAGQLHDRYVGPTGRTLFRLIYEAAEIPHLAEKYAEWSRSQILAARAIVRRAADRGELARNASATLIMDTLCGGVMTHVLTTAPDLREKMKGKSAAYLDQLTDFVIRAARTD